MTAGSTVTAVLTVAVWPVPALIASWLAAPAVAASALAAYLAATALADAAIPDTDFELVFRPDPHVWDGKFANNAWLQELPKPLSKVVWDNAAYMSFNTAKNLGLDVSNQERPQLIELTPPGTLIAG